MKSFFHNTIIPIKWIPILFRILFFVNEGNAQIISNNSAYISIGSGTVIGTDTINNDNTTTLANAGTITLNSIINAGTTQGNGTYNIARAFTNTGTFTC